MAGVGRGRRRETGSGWREDARGTLGPLALMLAGVALGVVQWRLDGGPPAPSGAHIREVLSGTVLADSDVIATAAAIAIAIASLVVGSLALRVALSLIAGDGVTADRAHPGAGDGDGGGAVAPAIGPERRRRVEVVAVRRGAPARRASGSDDPRLAPPAWSPDGAPAPAGFTVGGGIRQGGNGDDGRPCLRYRGTDGGDRGLRPCGRRRHRRPSAGARRARRTGECSQRATRRRRTCQEARRRSRDPRRRRLQRGQERGFPGFSESDSVPGWHGANHPGGDQAGRVLHRGAPG